MPTNTAVVPVEQTFFANAKRWTFGRVDPGRSTAIGLGASWVSWNLDMEPGGWRDTTWSVCRKCFLTRGVSYRVLSTGSFGVHDHCLRFYTQIPRSFVRGSTRVFVGIIVKLC